MLVAGMSVLALGLAFAIPLRWGVIGYLAAAAMLFVLQFGVNAASGFEGASIEESLLLFNGSLLSYLGFNVQITYRAFALPLLALGAAMVLRASLRRD
ncbi:hypothetical protein [Dinoroseobacter sp. S76]|uniref:hypothetical protein n=1 Tax=Dinoroseobacter sp. S76 TaxID=3415124 RepID=UPI003C7CB377